MAENVVLDKWVFLYGTLGLLLSSGGGLIYQVAKKYKRAEKHVQKQQSANNVIDQMREGASGSEYRMVTGIILPRDNLSKKNEQQAK